MAPNLQQRLQHAWDNVNAVMLAQPGPCDPHTHLSNFLQDLGHRLPSNPSGFRLHFPFPFAGLFLSRENKARSINASNSLVGISHGDLLSHKQVLVSENGNEASQSLRKRLPTSEDEHIRYVDGTNSHGNLSSLPTDHQPLQTQHGISALGSSMPASKEVLGHATWIFLHTLAAQFPEKPTRQQQRDAKELMAILSRLYPCKECANHFKEVLKANPVEAGSGVEFVQWMCMVHNVVNRSLGKSLFPCQRVDARWGAMDCDEGACSLQGRMH